MLYSTHQAVGGRVEHFQLNICHLISFIPVQTDVCSLLHSSTLEPVFWGGLENPVVPPSPVGPPNYYSDPTDMSVPVNLNSPVHLPLTAH